MECDRRPSSSRVADFAVLFEKLSEEKDAVQDTGQITAAELDEIRVLLEITEQITCPQPSCFTLT